MSVLNSRLLSIAFLTVTCQFATAQQLVTPVKFGVTPDGSARIAVPIRVPAGVAGMQPNLALVYDSKDRRTSWLGVGWSLSGLSTITRCAKTMAQDGVREGVKLSDQDRYCLDGERLIAVNGVYGQDGTEYRTERDTFAKIVSHGASVSNPSGWFSVQTKAGRTMEFGRTLDSNMYAPNGTLTKGWALDKVTDLAGNYMTVTYHNTSFNNAMWDAGIFHPLRIEYSANAGAQTLATNAVVFLPMSSAYIFQFEAGYPIAGSANQIAGVISTYVGGVPGTNGALFGSYNINYDLGTQGGFIGQLTTIKECNDPVYTSNCLPTVNFTWEDKNLQAFQFWTGTNGFPGAQTDYQNYFVDLNGDGKKAWLQISQASDDAWIGKANADASMTSSSWTKVSQSVGALSAYAHYFADVNGDGKADWIRISRTTNEAWVALGKGDGNFDFWTKYTTAIGSEANYGHFFADIDGDGRADLIQISRTSDSAQFGLALGDGGFNYWSKTFTGNYGLANWDSYFVDMNGDGKADWVAVPKNSGNNIVAQMSLGDGTFNSVVDPARDTWQYWGNIASDITLTPGTKHYFADVNGDGLTDWIVVLPYGGAFYALSKGNGGFTKFVYLGELSKGTDLFADVNGDGRADWVTYNNSATDIRPATGDAANPTLNSSVSVPLPATGAFASGRQYLFADLNGDGRDDLIAIDTASKQAWIARSTGQTDTKITSFSNSPDATTSIVYKRLSDPSVYTPDTDAQYPLRDSVYPLLVSKIVPEVVASVVAPNGIGGTMTTNYTYGGQKTDLARHLVLGFRWVQSTQVEHGIGTLTEYRLDWPFTGTISAVTKTTATGGYKGLLSQSTYLYDCNDFVSQSGCAVGVGKRYFPFVSQVSTSSWDLNGAAFPSTVTSSQYDVWGNATQTMSTTSDGFSKTTTNTFNNDTASWRIGQLLRQVVTNTAP